MSVSKEKHVPLREYLQTGESIYDPEKFYKDARPKTAGATRGSISSQSSKLNTAQTSTRQAKKKLDFNMYEKKSNQKHLEIVELKRRANMINERIRQNNREKTYGGKNSDTKSVASLKSSVDLKYLKPNLQKQKVSVVITPSKRGSKASPAK